MGGKDQREASRRSYHNMLTLIQNFFIKAIDILEQSTGSEAEESQSSLGSSLEKAKRDAYDALCDSFNTKLVMQVVSDLVTAFNTIDRPSLNAADVRSVAQWITYMVNMFGLNESAPADSTSIGWAGSSIPEAAKPYIYPLSRIRDELRRKARSSTGITAKDLPTVTLPPDAALDSSGKSYADIFSNFTASVRSLASTSSSTSDAQSQSQPQPQDISKAVLQLCDRLRDVDLWDQGIYLEDSTTPDASAVVRPVTRELLAARQEREQRELAKQKAKEEREKEATAKAERGKLSHLQMFRTNEFSAWDDMGLPLKDVEGKEVAKSRAKKLKKDWEKQKKLHEVWLASQGK